MRLQNGNFTNQLVFIKRTPILMIMDIQEQINFTEIIFVIMFYSRKTEQIISKESVRILYPHTYQAN